MDRRTLLAVAGSAFLVGGTITQTRPSSGGGRPIPGTDGEPQPRPEEEPGARATTLEELIDALHSAGSGDTVYVPGDVEIDLNGVWMLQVPDGVRLTSDGRLGGPSGALLSTSEGDEGPAENRRAPKFQLGSGARFTGFRLEGHHHEYVNPIEEYDGDFYAHRGSGILAGTDAVVDHNEISGWPYSAVWAKDNAHIHHNYIHHNCWEGLGYGVTAPAGDHMPLIEYNEFNHNRHSIAASGGPEVGYVARHNVVGPDWFGHQFDMHGADGMVGTAGNEIIIRDNEFHATRTVEEKTRNPNAEVPAIHIRGTPVTGVWVEGNRFAHEARETAYKQTDGPHRVQFDDNEYGWSPDDQSAETLLGNGVI